MPINASHEYFEAEKRYFQAQSLDEKIKLLEDVIRKAPKHKGAENLLAELRLRLKKLKEKQEKSKKTGKGRKGIKKEGYQVVLIGNSNSGKSSLLRKLTNAVPVVSDVPFTTINPEIGTMDFENVRAQIVDLPAIDGNDFDFSVVNSADCLLIVVKNIEDINGIEKNLNKATEKRIFVFNKIDLLSENEKRKFDERCRGKRIRNYVLVSSKNDEGIEDLKGKILSVMEVIRVFTKGNEKRKDDKPFVLKDGSNVRDLAEGIYKGFSKHIKGIRLTGPSAKFANQKVGLNHVLKDRDIVEFKTI